MPTRDMLSQTSTSKSQTSTSISCVWSNRFHQTSILQTSKICVQHLSLDQSERFRLVSNFRRKPSFSDQCHHYFHHFDYFAIFSEQDHIYKEMKLGVAGGPSLVFYRYPEKGKTLIKVKNYVSELQAIIRIAYTSIVNANDYRMVRITRKE